MLANHAAEQLKIQFEIEINAPPAKVWEKLATIEGMNQWFARDLVFEHKVGGRFEMKGELPGDGPFRFTGQVVTLEPERELAFTWRDTLSNENAWPADTLVSFKLEPSANGTKVTMTHTGFEALGSGLAKPAYEGHIQGWSLSETLVDLKKAAEA
jgi:uncharacterized protein YndB with AHSA1/START domain